MLAVRATTGAGDASARAVADVGAVAAVKDGDAAAPLAAVAGGRADVGAAAPIAAPGAVREVAAGGVP